MFEVSFPELIILAVIVLLVLGPERLPRAARLAGLWVRRARAYWHSVKSELDAELMAEEMRHNLEATRKAVAQMEAEARQFEQQMSAPPPQADDGQGQGRSP
ncbi:twin-arginine translocase subunit TatB [Lysobacteraceae bacterium NML120232]|nr:twin-arginine translocase subunit TatB [Xanthomonadaceae bacterium NML08-0793]PJK13592.1 twin-arginine translocase subunit TatB [Xanthomonadaceae bacterium NML120232]